MPPKRCQVRSKKRTRDTQATQENIQTFEEELRSALLDAPTDSAAATSADALPPNDSDISSDDERYTDNYDGIQWEAIKQYIKPLRTQKRQPSWIYKYGYRVASLKNPKRTFFVSAAAIWKNHQSVTHFVMTHYDLLLSTVRRHLSSARSLIHFTFDGWTAKGGKKAFLGVHIHYLDDDGNKHEYPIALPQLAGTHTGERLGEVVNDVIRKFGIESSQVGYFVLDNIGSNNVAVDILAKHHYFNGTHRRLRCGPHTLNLIGQTVIFGIDRKALEVDTGESAEEAKLEARYLQEWRKDGPLGMLRDVIAYISTPQQHDLLRDFQVKANEQLPDPKFRVKEIKKPGTTRWNSYHDAFERAVELQQPLDAYMQYHIGQYRREIAARLARNPNAALVDVPDWMRTEGLTAQDWQVIIDYIRILQPLKVASKRLEGRGKCGRFGALYEVIPTFEYLLRKYESQFDFLKDVDYNEADAPEDHELYNIRAAWKKLRKYYVKLDDSPAYYTATILHPQYKFYCDNSWMDTPHWLNYNNAQFQALWQSYKGESGNRSETPPRPKRVRYDAEIDDDIDQYTGPVKTPGDDEGDEFIRWKRVDNLPRDHPHAIDPIAYWLSLSTEYPNLSRMALDILSIPAASADCERLFSEVGDMLEPKRRKLSGQLTAALTCVRSWISKGFAVATLSIKYISFGNGQRKTNS
ncbi:hypothetical protein G6011_03036 [Alternaria panax]|uniref:HAT C-terminal dimerisation domain-containing protein n=1 Tax=Alternaria panax TaxID=48097 RepID=A0AAD4FCP6_9PLEO|nr:hypothetical protein G6011_03036 [Alternaria panax]